MHCRKFGVLNKSGLKFYFQPLSPGVNYQNNQGVSTLHYWVFTVCTLFSLRQNQQGSTQSLTGSNSGMNWHCLYLSPSLSSPILPPLLEPCVPVRADDAVVQPGAVDKPHGVLSICSRVVPEALCKDNSGCFLLGTGKKNEGSIVFEKLKSPHCLSSLFCSSLWDPKLHSCKSKVRPAQKGFCTLM